MKKFIVGVLVFIMVFSLVGCGSSEVPADEIIEDVVVEENIEEAGEETDNLLNIVEPVVIIDNEYITFTIKSVVYDELWETYGLTVYIENKTDEAVWYTWEEVSVNGFMCDPFWATEIAAGKKENTEIYWYLTDFEENGIDYTAVTDIEFILNSYHIDEETWDTTTYVNETFVLNFN